MREPATKPPFPIVGVGASAGGLEAFSELLRAVPPDSGMALIFLQHQEPKRASMLREILGRVTMMPVSTIAGDTAIERDHVYLAPSGAQVIVSGGRLHLNPDGGTSSMPIDHFLTSLAEDQGPRAVGVVLSGVASDGSLGIRAVKAEGGVTIAQDDSAKFDGMPRSAISSGSVDFILPPGEIARQLVLLARQPVPPALDARIPLPKPAMQQIFAVLKGARDIDFTHYKPATVERRIRRRMVLQRIETADDYLERLRSNPAEMEALYNDLLIRVTGFFRDPAVFEALQKEILPAIMADRANNDPMRVWVPGCATGEEVYSLAICMLEHAAATGWSGPFQIFGTDVNETAVDYARAGAYTEAAVGDVPPERLRRFFSRTNGGYRVNKAVRDCCIFARQNLTKDPPFSRLDLISCRNVMIYLGSVLQQRVMSIFHYALRPSGYLILGSSETIGSFSDLFKVVDRKHKIYQKRAGVARLTADFEMSTPRERPERIRIDDEVSSTTNVFRDADRVALSRYAPAGVLINESGEILQFRGRTSSFLEPAPGMASFNLLKMAREGLLAELRTAIHAARKTDAPVRRQNILVRNNGGTITVNLELLPFTTAQKHYQLVLFEEVVPEPGGRKRGRKAPPPPEDSRQSARLKREIEATREYLQSIIEEQEAMNEELRSANEEIQSSNEELQSTNEELETAKEELQSSNEELTTLNEELENRNVELAQANNDLVNFLASIDIPIVMLDSDLRIRRFNPGAQRVLNLIPADVGRSINDLQISLMIDDLHEMITSVIENLEVRERQVSDRQGRRFILRVRPYKTTENKIEGALLVLLDLGGGGVS